jgi:thioredoxin-related protein
MAPRQAKHHQFRRWGRRRPDERHQDNEESSAQGAGRQLEAMRHWKGQCSCSNQIGILHLQNNEYKEISMLTRRSFLAGSAAGALAPGFARNSAAQAVLTDDGLYRQAWFLDSLLELADDLNDAAKAGKRFAILWELKGCPYCKEIHLVNFARPEIERFVRARFDILQLNIIGAREVTDFDGEKLPEKRLAEKYGVRFTPTFQFFPERTDGLSARKPAEREVLRMQGYVEPGKFLGMFRFVAERTYERGTLADFLKANS